MCYWLRLAHPACPLAIWVVVALLVATSVTTVKETIITSRFSEGTILISASHAIHIGDEGLPRADPRSAIEWAHSCIIYGPSIQHRLLRCEGVHAVVGGKELRLRLLLSHGWILSYCCMVFGSATHSERSPTLLEIKSPIYAIFECLRSKLGAAFLIARPLRPVAPLPFVDAQLRLLVVLHARAQLLQAMTVRTLILPRVLAMSAALCQQPTMATTSRYTSPRTMTNSNGNTSFFRGIVVSVRSSLPPARRCHNAFVRQRYQRGLPPSRRAPLNFSDRRPRTRKSSSCPKTTRRANCSRRASAPAVSSNNNNNNNTNSMFSSSSNIFTLSSFPAQHTVEATKASASVSRRRPRKTSISLQPRPPRIKVVEEARAEARRIAVGAIRMVGAILLGGAPTRPASVYQCHEAEQIASVLRSAPMTCLGLPTPATYLPSDAEEDANVLGKYRLN
ncbi:hypothetical protein BKA63DRAFT_587572 [Paraphoma chrysanthemicola]|nr:hypothetical protein BKA63DRAFT_587572 [Paraphoma chrysanthemicola]